jgi:hypothetical protein
MGIPSVRGFTPYHIVEKPCCASQHFGPPAFRNGLWAAVRHRPRTLPQRLGKLTIRVAINRNAEAVHDAANLAK